MSDTPLFDRVIETPPAPVEPAVLSVSELTAQVQALLEQAFATVWVVGEISSFKRHGSGHLYFNLKDEGAVIRSVMWRSTAQRHKFPIADGLQVVVRGRLSVYAQRGDYQLYVDALQPKGGGAQELALRLLKEKLAKLGYFAAERKKRLPRFPRRIALVTSPTGAAVRDMLEKLVQRWPLAEIWVCPVRVQGPTAPFEIAAALRRLNQLRGIDVLLLGRGGGSSEDLGAFNDEAVARSIFESWIPIVSAVGHEIDFTIADMVADCRASTPTDAVVRATPDRAELMLGLASCRQRLGTLLIERTQALRGRLQALAERRAFRFPLERLRERERRLDDTEERLHRAMRQRLGHAGQRLEAHAARLQTLSPLNVLARGYSLTRTADGARLVHSALQVQSGDGVEVLIADGRLLATVERVLPPLESLRVTP
ncbi:MAG: exodeoxyribonuclease VII large subunit [Gemmataceae bacterium]|nr:exodeoxyribonuclease VII large subunit [Gemmataceae bacterium]